MFRIATLQPMLFSSAKLKRALGFTCSCDSTEFLIFKINCKGFIDSDQKVQKLDRILPRQSGVATNGEELNQACSGASLSGAGSEQEVSLACFYLQGSFYACTKHASVLIKM